MIIIFIINKNVSDLLTFEVRNISPGYYANDAYCNEIDLNAVELNWATTYFKLLVIRSYVYARDYTVGAHRTTTIC